MIASISRIGVEPFRRKLGKVSKPAQMLYRSKKIVLLFDG
jgi:hypothetical protein